ncbi:hypothetical protein BBJ28_00023394, partial [Nothophytophthora sp. Chile5]
MHERSPRHRLQTPLPLNDKQSDGCVLLPSSDAAESKTQPNAQTKHRTKSKMTHVVIIGGGPAGIACAQGLAKQLKASDKTEVVVLEKSAYFYHVIGAPRAYVEAEYTNKMFIPYDDAIPKHAAGYVRVMRAVATAISADRNEVSYRTIGSDDKESATTQTLHFHYLVLAMGSTYTVPIKQDSSNYARSTTEAQLREVRSQVEKANKILAKYPTKTVTILDAQNKLVASNNLRDKFNLYLNLALDKLDVKVILGERLIERLDD